MMNQGKGLIHLAKGLRVRISRLDKHHLFHLSGLKLNKNNQTSQNKNNSKSMFHEYIVKICSSILKHIH
jgi:hypothetical protein